MPLREHPEPLGSQRRIGVVLHPSRDVRESLDEISRWAQREGWSVAVAEPAGRFPLPPGVDVVPDATLARTRGMLIALGGDGTMLHALTAGAAHGTPVLGVKLGHTNYLAEVEPGELGAALDALALRRFAIEQRSMLAVHDGDAVTPAVNDVVLRRLPGDPLAEVSLQVRGEEIARFRGDGVIVATPTGSTGYSRSAGGPLASPRLAATIVTPLAARDAPASSVVLPAREAIELRTGSTSAELALEIDGRVRPSVRPAARLWIDQSGPPCRLIRLGRLSSPPAAEAA